jgi:hypothetical protein
MPGFRELSGSPAILRVMQHFKWSVLKSKRKILYLVVPATLLVGVGSVVSAQAAPSSPSFAATTNPAEPAVDPETADPASAPEAPANEPANEPAGAADAGHQDAGAKADHQFDGQE